MGKTFFMTLEAIQPSQLYVSSEKLSEVSAGLDRQGPDSLEPVPVKALGGQVVFTDGHTRALAAFLRGLGRIRVFWDEDELDWEAYRICVQWCIEEGVRSIADLAERVVAPREYELLWHARCREMHEALAARRRGEE